MKIDKVTMTGADDSCDPSALVEISKQFPTTEWGILFSKSSEGHNRFPTYDWTVDFLRKANANGMKCCAHLCGSWVRELVQGGKYSWFVDRGELFTSFQRVQINFHAEPHTAHPDFFKVLKEFPGRQFILQADQVNDPILQRCLDHGIDAVPLFDVSHGAGILPESWPKPIDGLYCGYAGGLGPENLKSELARIGHAVGDRTIWIDAETKIRSCGDRIFDLEKVRSFLTVAADYASVAV